MKNQNKLSEKIKQKAIKQAEEMGNCVDDEKVSKVSRTLQKMNKGPVKKIWDKVTLLWQTFNSSETPLAQKILIIGSLIYLVTPVDIVPDVFFPAGLLDDVAVIAFIYSQCKDLIKNTIPAVANGVQSAIKKTGDTACEQIERVTDKALEETVGRQFKAYSKRSFINSMLRLLLFASSLLLFYFSKPSWTFTIALAEILLAVFAIWFTYTRIRNVISFIITSKKFINNFNAVNERCKEEVNKQSDKEIINSSLERGYKEIKRTESKLMKKEYPLQNRVAESLYNSLTTKGIDKKQTVWKKVCSFMFKKWNEGKLPSWVPNKKFLVEKTYNTVKLTLCIYLISLIGYILVYSFLGRAIMSLNLSEVSTLAQSQMTFWQFILFPFKYALNLIF